MGIRTINELAQQAEIDVAEFGLKAEGLAILKRARKAILKLPINNRHESGRTAPLRSIDYEIDPAFVVPRSIALEETSALRDAYATLVADGVRTITQEANQRYNTPLTNGIMLARSSSANEEPGKFLTAIAPYDASDMQGSLHRWLDAARRVRESGAEAVIAQMLVAHPTGEPPVFGSTNASFVSNTGGFYGPNIESITCALGLPSKIVRGDPDVNTNINDHKTHLTVIHGSHNYLQSMHVVHELPQKRMDVMRDGKLTEVPCKQRLDLYSDKEGVVALPGNATGLYTLFMLQDCIREVLGAEHIEIEGTFAQGDYFPHLLQLRPYSLPANRLEKLTAVEAERVLYKARSFGADSMRGDLVILTRPDIAAEAVRARVSGPYMLLVPEQDEHHRMEEFDFTPYQDRVGTVFPIHIVDQVTAAAHTFGFMMGVLKRHQQQTKALAIQFNERTMNDRACSIEYCGNAEYHDQEGFAILRDVVLESDGTNAQIYSAQS